MAWEVLCCFSGLADFVCFNGLDEWTGWSGCFNGLDGVRLSVDL